MRRRDSHAFGARIALAISLCFPPKELSARPAAFAPNRPGFTSTSHESRGTIGAGCGGVERRTSFAPEGHVRPVGGRCAQRALEAEVRECATSGVTFGVASYHFGITIVSLLRPSRAIFKKGWMFLSPAPGLR
eukprot:331608-Prymnesium_polylepis.1